MERKRARLPHSDSGRLICPNAVLTNHGAAAKAPIETSAIAAAWRIEGLILSAINMPRPRPMAVPIAMSNGSTGSCSAVFEMDIGRDIAYHIRHVLKKEPQMLPANHIIADGAAFQETLALAADAAEETGELVTIGIKPTWACPAFGYIEQGAPVHLPNRADENAIHRVLRFREKPNPDLAESFLRKGNFRWNAGMFVWSVPTVLSEFNRQSPQLADFISQLRDLGSFE